jgi:hypothetical protein
MKPPMMLNDHAEQGEHAMPCSLCHTYPDRGGDAPTCRSIADMMASA